MQVIEIKNKEQWNEFVASQQCTQFLQSWEWGEFHKKMGRKVWRIAMLADGNCEIVLAAQIIKYKLPFGQSYLYSPRGPVCKFQKEVLKLFLAEIKKLAAREKNIFFRMEPMGELENYKELEFNIHKVKSAQPENEWLLDLRKNEDEILKEMRQKTRYNIRLAEKKGVKIKIAESKDDFNKFWNLISDTYNRKQIRTHSKEYYKGILEIGEVVKLWLAEYQGKAVATNIISYFGDTATYMHGGADYEYRNIMSPYLLQWEAIKDAKSKGFNYYNFGGCSETNSYWQGITRFKKGFGGFEIKYNGTYEIGFKRFLYELYSFAKSLRR